MNITNIEAALADMRDALIAALANGQNTAPLRANITGLESDLAEARRVQAVARRAAVKAADGVIANAAEALATQAHVNIEAGSQVAGLAELAGETLPLEQDPELIFAAGHVARAQAALEQAETAYQPVKNQLEMLTNRLQAKQQATAAIRTRRNAGDDQPGDAAELALLAADTEALGLLVGDSQAKASASAPDTQRRALQAAQAQMQNVAGHAAFKVARDRVLQAEQVFLKAHAALISAGAAIGERNQFSIFKASNELRRITYGA
ncbi:hypothetical protein [Pseudomonas sp.]|uniref:hypothetical protein n=1 Tax=Pseudomonas sp. TaxID=306 RepID=UPI003FD8C094